MGKLRRIWVMSGYSYLISSFESSVVNSFFHVILRTSNPISFDKQFRCHIFGWALGATLIPHIFKKVNDKVKEDYTQVVETHGIDVQGPQSPLKRWPADFHWKFDYKNINGNREASRDGKSDHSLLNYNVSNHVDFARLYVGQHAAEDITFNGDSDPRPLLCVIAHGPFFSAAARRAARYLMDARDDWAHFLYSKWNLEKFNRCFKELEQLVVEMDLCSEVQKKLVGQIDMWQTIGNILVCLYIDRRYCLCTPCFRGQGGGGALWTVMIYGRLWNQFCV